MLTAAAIEGYKQYTERSIHRAQYKVGSTWRDAVITKKERLPDGRVAVYFAVFPQSASATTVSGVRLYDKAGNLWAEKAESITISATQEGILYRFTFDFHEEET